MHKLRKYQSGGISFNGNPAKVQLYDQINDPKGLFSTFNSSQIKALFDTISNSNYYKRTPKITSLTNNPISVLGSRTEATKSAAKVTTPNISNTSTNVPIEIPSNKINSIGNTTGIIGEISSFANSFIKNDDSALTKGLDSSYDSVSNAVSTLGPVGAIVGGAMKVGGLANSIMKKSGIGTDQVTTSDQVWGSNYLALTPMGLANSLGATKLHNFDTNYETISKVGSAYGGAMEDIKEAQKYGGKKVGLFTNSNKYNNKIYQGNLVQTKMTNIANRASDRQTNSQNPLLGLETMLNKSGGYSQVGTSFGQQGIKIQMKSKLESPSPQRIKEIVNYSKSKTANNYKKYWNSTKKYTIQTKKMGGNLEFAKHVLSMKSGGAFNIIPIGALHKNLHHLEDVDEKYKEVTAKGIPVICEDGSKIQQQAEVEREEIIFNIDVTNKLEELQKKGTDDAAIEAGKLLVHEILSNTKDKSGLIKATE